METLKKILTFLKDFFKGALYLGLAAGIMMLVAAALFHFQPFDLFSDQAPAHSDPQRVSPKQAWKIFIWGAEAFGGSFFLLWFVGKIEGWWIRRPRKWDAAQKKAPDEAPKEAA